MYDPSLPLEAETSSVLNCARLCKTDSMGEVLVASNGKIFRLSSTTRSRRARRAGSRACLA
jgi:hypothetical protein